ncbi:hypothetical protein A3F66_05205 [candidate division TM6 bacterium RIFCSPHIGHO2_12_FULL_32_22]|nr:MAG: hypothetical protein A3F66_05205 [candidate division TM6 bacterium RIFCSPHIGHO2_12_FULL_32_22]
MIFLLLILSLQFIHTFSADFAERAMKLVSDDQLLKLLCKDLNAENNFKEAKNKRPSLFPDLDIVSKRSRIRTPVKTIFDEPPIKASEDYIFKDIDSLYRDTTRFINEYGEWILRCPCGYVVKHSSHNMSRHYKTHFAPQYICSKCYVRFTLSKGLTQHNRIAHGAKLNQLCCPVEGCQAKSTKRALAKIHWKQFHSEEFSKVAYCALIKS